MKGKDAAVLVGLGAAVAAGVYLATRGVPCACDLSHFYEKLKHLGQMVYTKDNSDLLMEIYNAGQGDYQLTVFHDQMPIGMQCVGPVMPPVRTWQEALAGWEIGVEKIRQICELDNNYAWVSWKCLLEPLVPVGVDGEILSISVL